MFLDLDKRAHPGVHRGTFVEFNSAPRRWPVISRRDFLKTSGSGVAGASLLAMLDARQAPALLKGTILRIIQWSHFVPAYHIWCDGFAKVWGTKHGLSVGVDRVPQLELPA